MMARALGLVLLALLITAGCTSLPSCQRVCVWIVIPSAPPVEIARPAEPAPATPPAIAAPTDAPKPPAERVKMAIVPGPSDHAKKITSARADLKTGMTALELRAVTACTEPGEACVENQGLMDRAQALDGRLAAALVDPKVVVDWPEVTTVLRAIVESAMRPGVK